MGSFGFHCANCDLPMLSDGPDKHDYCFKCEEPFCDHDRGGGCQSTNYLMSPDGKVWKEENYEGYGVYGGKDAHALLAQTNVEGIREWYSHPSADMPNMKDWEPTGDDDDDRSVGIDMCYGKWRKTHEEIAKMVDDGITITKDNIYHYSNDFIKNPLRIVCEACFTDGRFGRPVNTYDEMDSHEYSRDHKDQSWSNAHNTDVGWVCQDCGGY